MIFRNSESESIEINPTGWDPAEEWVIVKVRGNQSKGYWEARDHSLLYNEAIDLADWLSSLDSSGESSLVFMEPELEFNFNSGNLKIFLEWKYRPPWAPSDVDSNTKYFLEFDVSKSELKKQANSWKSEINNVCK